MQEAIEQSRRELRGFINYIRTKDESKSQEIKNEYCSFCMLSNNLVATHNRIVHVNCWNIIKTLSMK